MSFFRPGSRHRSLGALALSLQWISCLCLCLPRVRIIGNNPTLNLSVAFDKAAKFYWEILSAWLSSLKKLVGMSYSLASEARSIGSHWS